MASVAATLFSLPFPFAVRIGEQNPDINVNVAPEMLVETLLDCLSRQKSFCNIFSFPFFFNTRLDRWNNRISKFLFSYTRKSSLRLIPVSTSESGEEKRERKRENRNVSFPRVNPISASLGTICSNGRRRSTFAND